MSKSETNPDLVERVSAKVHDAWWREKWKQGFHPPIECPHSRPHPAIGEEEAREAALTKHCDFCHTDMYEYDLLPEHVKDYDRATVRAVFSAMDEVESPKGGQSEFGPFYVILASLENEPGERFVEIEDGDGRSVWAAESTEGERPDERKAGPFFTRPPQHQWRSIESAPPEMGPPILGYNEAWIDPDFNPVGIRECFLYGDGTMWMTAKWCNDHDCYHTTTEDAPTHWRPFPAPPEPDDD